MWKQERKLSVTVMCRLSSGWWGLLLLLLLAYALGTTNTQVTADSHDSNTSSRHRLRRPVLLKFYKVGSESVVDFFLRMSVDPGDIGGGGGGGGGGRGYKSWVANTPSCDGLPMVS